MGARVPRHARHALCQRARAEKEPGVSVRGGAIAAHGGLGLAINAIEAELDATAAFCRSESIGIEVTAFAFPAGLDHDFERRVAAHRKAVAGITPVACHGPFLDLYTASPDPEIVAVCRRRHERALDAAAAIGASVYVAHLGFLPVIRNPGHGARFVEATSQFWVPLADRAAQVGITVVLENLWEPAPDLQQRVVEQASHPALKASFDNGHSLMFSVLPSSEWIRVLAPVLAHCHLHDNDGELDRHWPIGSGQENWDALFRALDRSRARPLVVLESDGLEANRQSLERARHYWTI